MSEDYIKFIKIGGDEHPIDATKMNGVAASGYQIKNNLVTSLDIVDNRKSYKYPSAACLYRMVGDLSTVDDGSESGELTSQTYTLTLTVTAGLGTITGGTSGESYPAGTVLTLTAVPDGSTFTGWSDGVTDITRTVTMNSDITLGATFQLSSHIDESGELDYPTLDDLID